MLTVNYAAKLTKTVLALFLESQHILHGQMQSLHVHHQNIISYFHVQ